MTLNKSRAVKKLRQRKKKGKIGARAKKRYKRQERVRRNIKGTTKDLGKEEKRVNESKIMKNKR